VRTVLRHLRCQSLLKLMLQIMAQETRLNDALKLINLFEL
jgi:hypothetical protein